VIARARVDGETGAGPWSSSGDEVDLVVLVNGFPRLSETFVLQELLDLERRGVRLLVIALSRPSEIVRQEALGHLRGRVEYVPERLAISRRRVARAHAVLLRWRGVAYGAGLADLVRAPDCTSGAVRRAVLLASRLIGLGSPPLYIQFAHRPGTVGRFAARLAGVPYALSAHAKDIWLTPPDELAAKVRGARVVLTCTAAGQQELERHSGGVTPVRLAYHGVDVDVTTARPGLPGPPRILSAGRLVEKKGHDVLIRAAAVLRDRGLAFSVRIAGEGVEWPRLQRLVHELDLGGCVTFLGPLSPGELETEYESATAFALACRQLASGDRDGLPNVVLEAMARGLPVVSTTHGSVGEAVDDERTGLLASAEDPEALALALERLLTQPGLAARLGRAAVLSVRHRFDRDLLLHAVADALTDAGLINPTVHGTQAGGAGLEEREAA
jgi:glycosyltransferase involved in cell wall biosynthesis